VELTPRTSLNVTVMFSAFTSCTDEGKKMLPILRPSRMPLITAIRYGGLVGQVQVA
jgi:hypothetical protein